MAGTRVLIAVGDLFRKANSTNWVWQVRDIFAPTGHCPHARIFRLLDPSDERVFSLSALKDKRLFIPVGQPKRASGENLRTFRERELSPLSAVAIVKKAS